jgi:hypothetical protein
VVFPFQGRVLGKLSYSFEEGAPLIPYINYEYTVPNLSVKIMKMPRTEPSKNTKVLHPHVSSTVIF